ncbi:MAG TPA: RNA 2',3'-cyclic phosphodiesterase [Ktedonobacteraceae bacterium]|nr:RNA 2',3'-cyclic phosphodiesterase [Ktedonobacteraceae bacterium]
MTRTFIALALDESLQLYLDGIMHRMARELPDLRWVDSRGMHLTLAFLGELNDQQVSEAINATELAARTVSPFVYRLSHPGIFGSPDRPRIIWIGVDESSGTLINLHQQLNQELERHGFAIDTRPFSPHLTLSRVKAPLKVEEQQSLRRILAGKDFQSASPICYVQHISVMKSELSRTGASYTCLRNVSLGPNGG